MDEFKDGTCTWCREHGAVYANNGRCEDCDMAVVDCRICGCERHRESFCRHISEDRNLEYFGSGVGTPSNSISESFFKFLSAMPGGFAPALRDAIKSGKFHTWMTAPLIGGGGIITLYGMPDRSKDWMTGLSWGDAIIEAGERDDAEELYDGYRWLVSLYNKDTLAANRTTIAWIDEWIASRPDDLGRWADDGGRDLVGARL